MQFLMPIQIWYQIKPRYTNPSQTRGFSYLVAVMSQNDFLVLKVGSKLAVSEFAVPNFSVPKIASLEGLVYSHVGIRRTLWTIFDNNIA